MAKRKPTMDAELKLRLDTLQGEFKTVTSEFKIINENMTEINKLLKGSAVLNYKGVIEHFKDIQSKQENVVSQMEHWERWRQMQIAKKGTFTFKTADLLTKGLSIIGAVATTVAVVFTVLQIVDWFESKKLPKEKPKQETQKQSQPQSFLIEKTYQFAVEQLPKLHSA